METRESGLTELNKRNKAEVDALVAEVRRLAERVARLEELHPVGSYDA